MERPTTSKGDQPYIFVSYSHKDELSFVRELNKNRVLIYLEDVILPDEMQMRLGRLQAIHWNRDGEKKSALQAFIISTRIRQASRS